jgi:hypothetical protein
MPQGLTINLYANAMPKEFCDFGTELYSGIFHIMGLHWPIISVESKHHKGE